MFNDQIKFGSRPQSYKQNTRPRLHRFDIPVKNLFQIDLSIIFILSMKKTFLKIQHIILGLKLEFSLQHLKFKQKLCLHSKELQAM